MNDEYSLLKQNSIFEKYRKVDDNGNEYWSARDFYDILQYQKWKNFFMVIEKARESCKNSGQDDSKHFERVPYLIKIGSSAQRDVGDLRLSRYACYLIVQNADPSKKVVALGQTYFAVQTRKQEIQQSVEYSKCNSEESKRLFLRGEMKKFNLQLASAAKNAGVIRSSDYAIFQDYGYQGLYGGLRNRDLKEKRGLTKSQSLLDHMGSTELAANLFRATQTEEKLRRENIQGIENANQAHYDVGKKVRQTIEELGGTMPEHLPVADNIKKIEKKANKELGESNSSDT